MHLQPAFEACRAVGGDVAARLFEIGLCLPSGSSLTDEDQDRIVEIVRGGRKGSWFLVPGFLFLVSCVLCLVSG